ncbi:MAG: DUF4349 domain-containing protein [Mycobacterium sp.]
MAMHGGGIGVRVCVAAVAMAAGLLAGCAAGNDAQEAAPESYSAAGPAQATQLAPAPEAPVEDSTVTTTDIVVTGSIQMTVDDPVFAADKFAEATVAAGGRIESRSEQSSSGYPSATLTLRIPSDELDAVLAKIDDLGVVDAKNINYSDVTAQRVDLDARIEALQISVDRLLELMGKATSTEDLLAAESSLTERQAELDSLQAQRTALGDQIAYATITVDLTSTPPVIAQGGFIGAIKDGSHALVGAAGGLARTIGFLLPWTPVLGAIAALFVVIRRARRRRPPKPPKQQADPIP